MERTQPVAVAEGNTLYGKLQARGPAMACDIPLPAATALCGDISLCIPTLVLALVPQRLEVTEQWVGNQKRRVDGG